MANCQCPERVHDIVVLNWNFYIKNIFLYKLLKMRTQRESLNNELRNYFTGPEENKRYLVKFIENLSSSTSIKCF